MPKQTLLFCNGLSGTGKTYFIENIVPKSAFYKLVSATTRTKRPGEIDGVSYYFRDEKYFDTEKFATHLWVNKNFWKPGEPKWLYGIPEFEIYNHVGENMIYDVIQPCYTRELMDWFVVHQLDKKYDFKVAFFTTNDLDNFAIARERAVMQNDLDVRRANTCTMADFQSAGVHVDYITMPRDNKPNPELIKFVQQKALVCTK